MTRNKLRLIGLVAAVLTATLTLNSCEDFFGTEDLKAIIKGDVEAATAPAVTVLLKAE